MEIIPSDLATYGGEAKKILDDLQSRNERMFLITVLFLNAAKTKQELDSAVFQTAGIAQKFNCTLNRLDYMQEQGLMSSLPLANNLVPIKRALTTTSTAIFVPFTTQELFMEGDSLYYGLNAVSNNMIMADRKQLKNPNGLILGTPGSGKSFSAKREMTNVFFTTTDDIIIADPEGEYYPLVEALGGQVIHISSTSRDYINPMDINLNYADDDNPLGMKSDFILSLCELIMGARDGMEPEEKSVIDRCLPLVYQKYLNDPKPENMPILGDLYDCLREQKERQAQRIATALEIYVNGSLRVFNHQTNVELDNRLICFDIKELGKQLKKLGMLIVQDQVWNRVTINRNAKKNTRYYIDEFHFHDIKEPREDEVYAMGSKKLVASADDVKWQPKRFISRLLRIKKVCKENKIKVLHYNADTPMAVFNILAARAGGVKYVTIHSHNAGFEDRSNWFARFLCLDLKPLIPFVCKVIANDGVMVVNDPYDKKLTVIDITDLNDPHIVFSVKTSGNPDIAYISADRIFVPLKYQGYMIIYR